LSRFSDDLVLLIQLPHANDAAFSAGERNECFKPGTRIDILQDIEDWIEDTHTLPSYWLNGMAGTGKSTIAQSVARRGETVVFGQFKEDVGSVVPPFDPLSINALRPFHDREPTDISTSLWFLHSLLIVPEYHDLRI
jgi:hypothetical protein